LLIRFRTQRPGALADPPAACHFRGMLWRTVRWVKRPGIMEPCIPTAVSKPPVGFAFYVQTKNRPLGGSFRDDRFGLGRFECTLP
jgi:hypothetical protein